MTVPRLPFANGCKPIEMENDLIANPVSVVACSKCGHSMNVEGRAAFSSLPCEKCQTLVAVPVMLGSFLLVERMGAGGMGAVYRALDTALNRFVAIKVMKAALGEDAALVKSFISEARAAAALNHRNIVQIYSCGQENGQPYIVMELVAGGRMSNLFTREQPMDELKLLKMAMDIAEGLQAANQAGLVHGDIKPENILIDKHGTAKIVDFGLAQFVNAQKDRGEIWGTPYYISPERARGNKADHRSDIYSLGASLFHALAGEPPFEGETPVDVVLARLKHPPPSLAEIRPDLQAETVQLIERMMSADPQLRYPNPASLKADIHSAIHAAKNAAAGQNLKRRTSPAHLVAAGVVAVAVALGSYWLIGKTRKYKQNREAVPAEAQNAAKPVPAKTPLFNADEKQKLEAIVDAFSLNDPGKTSEELKSFFQDLLKNSKGHGYLWVRMFESVPLWYSGKDAEASALYSGDLFIAKDRDGEKVAAAKTAAAYLNGQATREQLEESGAPVDLVLFLEAGGLMAKREWIAAQERLIAYIGATNRTPPWAYVFQPLARELNKSIHNHLVTSAELDRLIADRQWEPALTAYRAYVGKAPAYFAAALAPYAQKIKDLEAQLASEKKAAEEAAYKARVQQDLTRLDGILAEIVPGMLQSNSFSVASILLTTRTSGLETDEGREAAQIARERIDALEGLKSFIYGAVDRAPFTKRAGFRLGGGDLTRASLQGLRTSVSGRPHAVYNWHEVPPETMVQIIDFYSQNDSIPAADRADALAGTAVFLFMHQQTNAAAKFATRALELNPDVRGKLDRLVPEVLAQPKE